MVIAVLKVDLNICFIFKKKEPRKRESKQISRITVWEARNRGGSCALFFGVVVTYRIFRIIVLLVLCGCCSLILASYFFKSISAIWKDRCLIENIYFMHYRLWLVTNILLLYIVYVMPFAICAVSFRKLGRSFKTSFSSPRSYKMTLPYTYHAPFSLSKSATEDSIEIRITPRSVDYNMW